MVYAYESALISVVYCFLVGCSNGISRSEIRNGSDRVRELEARVFATEQFRLKQWEDAETNRLVVQQRDRIESARGQFLAVMRQKSDFVGDSTTMDAYRAAFAEYVEQDNLEFANYMKEINAYPIGQRADEWPNMGTGGSVFLLFKREEDGQWGLSYEAKDVKEGKKISIAVYDGNGLFIERCEFTLDGEWTRVTEKKSKTSYDFDMAMAQWEAGNALNSMINNPKSTWIDGVQYTWQLNAPNRVSSTTSRAEWKAKDITEAIVLKVATTSGRTPAYYAVRVCDPGLAHKAKKWGKWTINGGVL